MFMLTPSPPALRSPLSPKGAREEELFVLSPYSWDTGHPIHHNLDSPERRWPLQTTWADYRIFDFSLIISPSTANLPYP